MAKPKKKLKTRENNGELREGTEDFEAACRDRLRMVAEKYAWTAQHTGIILRRNPLKLSPPYQDYVFNRISRAEYGFRYIDRRDRRSVWYPKAELVLAALDEPDADFGFIIAERVEFLPAEPELDFGQFFEEADARNGPEYRGTPNF
jgi:hypothetical protein